MARITVISGCPGSGKTTLSKRLANSSAMGVRIDTDTFYGFLAHRIDPSTPEAEPQNTTVVKAFLKASASFLRDGHDVYIDGVLGPWWLELMKQELTAFQYAILHASEEAVLGRTAERAKSTQASANPALVKIMHAQFEQLSGMQQRTLITTAKTPADIYREFKTRLDQGDFKVP